MTDTKRRPFTCERCSKEQYEASPLTMYDGDLEVKVCKACIGDKVDHLTMNPQPLDAEAKASL